MSHLLVIRGNPGSGKSTISGKLQPLVEDAVIVAQDSYLADKSVTLTPEQQQARKSRMFDDVRQALAQHSLVILEGAFDSRRYKEYFDQLHKDYTERSTYVYIDVSFEETLIRHQQRDKKDWFTEATMRGWYNQSDTLGYASEMIISQDTSADDAVALILATLRQ